MRMAPRSADCPSAAERVSGSPMAPKWSVSPPASNFAGSDSQTKVDSDPGQLRAPAESARRGKSGPQSRPEPRATRRPRARPEGRTRSSRQFPRPSRKTPPWWSAAVFTRSSVRMATRRSSSGSSFRVLIRNDSDVDKEGADRLPHLSVERPRSVRLAHGKRPVLRVCCVVTAPSRHRAPDPG